MRIRVWRTPLKPGFRGGSFQINIKSHLDVETCSEKVQRVLNDRNFPRKKYTMILRMYLPIFENSKKSFLPKKVIFHEFPDKISELCNHCMNLKDFGATTLWTWWEFTDCKINLKIFCQQFSDLRSQPLVNNMSTYDKSCKQTSIICQGGLPFPTVRSVAANPVKIEIFPLSTFTQKNGIFLV